MKTFEVTSLMTTCFGKVYQLCVCFFEGGMWNMMLLLSDHCLSFYFEVIKLCKLDRLWFLFPSFLEKTANSYVYCKKAKCRSDPKVIKKSMLSS